VGGGRRRKGVCARADAGDGCEADGGGGDGPGGGAEGGGQFGGGRVCGTDADCVL